MPIILRARQFIPVMQPDGSFVDTEFALIAFVHSDGQQYAQLNVEASEVEGFAEGESLAFATGAEHGLRVPSDHGQAILKGEQIGESLDSGEL